MHKTWQAGLYMRLSREDERNKESSSIDTQRKMLRRFCKENGFCVEDEYVDDGFSGTEMETRPALMRLISDVEMKKINLVVVKDLSRLGRNIGDVSALLDKFFPIHKVRFISVTDGTDSEKRDRTMRILTPLYNFTNELYAADLSDKIHLALKAKIENGDFIGSFAPYGYEKDVISHNRLLPDPVAAAIIKRIFQMAAQGIRPSEIAQKLNAEKVLTPSAYRVQKFPHTKDAFSVASKWSGGMVGKLLRNRTYLGHTVQGKTEKPSFKSKVTHTLPRTEWKEVQNTHEPLVSREIWDKVQIETQKRKNQKKEGFVNLFSGIAICADCGKHMSTSYSHGKIYLVCGSYKSGGKEKCSSHKIRYEVLEKTVFSALMTHLAEGEIIEDLRRHLSEEALQSTLLFTFIRKIEVSEMEESTQYLDVYLRIRD